MNKIKNIEKLKNKYYNMTDEQRQKYIEAKKEYKNYRKEYEKNMTDEQKQKYREAKKNYKINDEQKQKLKDYRREYYKKYCAAKKLNKQKLKDYRREYYKKYCAAKKLNNKTIDDDSFMMIVMPVIMKTIFNMLFFSKCI